MIRGKTYSGRKTKYLFQSFRLLLSMIRPSSLFCLDFSSGLLVEEEGSLKRRQRGRTLMGSYDAGIGLLGSRSHQGIGHDVAHDLSRGRHEQYHR